VRQTLVRVLADEQISVIPEGVAHVSEASPLNPELFRPLEQLTEEYWPGTPVVPTLCPGATDARFLRNAGIPTYGIGVYVTDLDDSRGHARDERIPVATFYEGDVFLRRLLKMISGGR
jgi:acetylornithine deacetylase/succinyl-diaminopimelate desuccinylase-like protein